MKKLELKHQLHVVIVLLIISSLLVLIEGCSTKSGLFGDKSNFRPEYYAARQLQNEDIVKLRELTVSTDPFVADSATLILGSYYLYYGDKNYGRVLINRTYNSSNLKGEIVTLAKLWKMESLLSEKNELDAITMAEEVKSDKHTDEYRRALSIYCNQLNVKINQDEDINKCIDSVIAGKIRSTENKAETVENDKPINTDNMTYDEYLAAIGINVDSPNKNMESEEEMVKEIETTSELDLIDGDLFSDIASGIILSMKHHDNNFQLKPISAIDAENSKSKMSVDVKNYHLRIGSTEINFAPNYDMLAKVTSELNILKRKSIVIIISGSSTYEKGKIIAEYLKPSLFDSSKKGQDRVREVKLLNFDSGYQKEMQYTLSGKDEQEYAIVLLGKDNEVTEMIPIAKYWQINKKIHDIVVATSFITPFKYVNEEYEKYYQDFYIVTHGYLNNDEKYTKPNEEYQSVYGKPMSADNILGYDMITYINSSLNKMKNYEYISNIKNIKNNKVYRKAYLHYVEKSGITLKNEFDVKEDNDIENGTNNAMEVMEDSNTIN